MEEQEKDTLFLMALAVFGAVLASSLAVFLQSIVVLPLTIVIFLIMILTALFTRKRVAHLSEKLETLAMILVLLAFIASFIYLFKPA